MPRSRIGRSARRAAACLLLAASTCPTACRPAGEAAATDLPAAGWSEAATVRYANTDTLRLRGLHLFLRLGENFREDTLTLCVETCSPDRLRTREYHRLVCGAPDGTAPVRRIVERPYRSDVRLHAAGDYYFVLTPVRAVHGIEAAGVRITTDR